MCRSSLLHKNFTRSIFHAGHQTFEALHRNAPPCIKICLGWVLNRIILLSIFIDNSYEIFPQIIDDILIKWTRWPWQNLDFFICKKFMVGSCSLYWDKLSFGHIILFLFFKRCIRDVFLIMVMQLTCSIHAFFYLLDSWFQLRIWLPKLIHLHYLWWETILSLSLSHVTNTKGYS